jgi:hypothetical protein
MMVKGKDISHMLRNTRLLCALYIVTPICRIQVRPEGGSGRALNFSYIRELSPIHCVGGMERGLPRQSVPLTGLALSCYIFLPGRLFLVELYCVHLTRQLVDRQ